MAYTTPKTWAAGETVTSDMLNTHLRDNMVALKALIDALGGGPSVVASSVTSETKTTSGETFYTITVPGGTLANNGDRLRLTLYGYSASVVAANIYVYPQFGATALAFIQGGSSANLGIILRAEIQRLSATTQFMWGGHVSNNTGGGSSVEYTANASPAETLANDVSLTIKMSASATRSITVYGYLLEFLPAA